MPDQFYAYSPSAAIKIAAFDVVDGALVQIPALPDLEGKLEIDLLTVNNKVKKNKRFVVEVKLPRVDPLNLVPLKKKNKAFRLPIQLLAVDLPALTAGAFTSATTVIYGVPISSPRRRHRFGKNLPRQTFKFPAFDWVATGSKIVMWARSIHKYYDDFAGANGVSFANRRIVSKPVIVDVD